MNQNNEMTTWEKGFADGMYGYDCRESEYEGQELAKYLSGYECGEESKINSSEEEPCSAN